MNWSIALYVGIGGFFGAISRYLLSSIIQKNLGLFFPTGTLFVNILGSFIIGFLAMFFANIISPEYKALMITGFLGALTTFSTFSLESVMMLQDGEYVKFALNILLNVSLCILSTLISIYLFKKIYLTTL